MVIRPHDDAPKTARRGSARAWLGLQVAMWPAVVLAGCQHHDNKYRVAEEEEVVPIRAADLGVPNKAPTRIGATLLSTEPSVGRFPAGICVVRVKALQCDANKQRDLRISPLPAQHAVYWNLLFDDLPSIREVVFLANPGLDPRGYRWPELLHAASQHECSLCVLYAEQEATDADAEYYGVLWDTQAMQALATFRIPVVLPEEFTTSEEDDEDDEDEQRIALWEARFRAEQDLRRTVRDTLWDLAKRDGAVLTTQPSPWRSGVPIFPHDYERYRDPRYKSAHPFGPN